MEDSGTSTDASADLCGDVTAIKETVTVTNGLKKMVVYESKLPVNNAASVNSFSKGGPPSCSKNQDLCGKEACGEATPEACGEATPDNSDCISNNHHSAGQSVVQNGTTCGVNIALPLEAAGKSDGCCNEYASSPPSSSKESYVSDNAATSCVTSQPPMLFQVQSCAASDKMLVIPPKINHDSLDRKSSNGKIPSKEESIKNLLTAATGNPDVQTSKGAANEENVTANQPIQVLQTIKCRSATNKETAVPLSESEAFKSSDQSLHDMETEQEEPVEVERDNSFAEFDMDTVKSETGDPDADREISHKTNKLINGKPISLLKTAFGASDCQVSSDSRSILCRDLKEHDIVCDGKVNQANDQEVETERRDKDLNLCDIEVDANHCLNYCVDSEKSDSKVVNAGDVVVETSKDHRVDDNSIKIESCHGADLTSVNILEQSTDFSPQQDSIEEIKIDCETTNAQQEKCAADEQPHEVSSRPVKDNVKDSGKGVAELGHENKEIKSFFDGGRKKLSDTAETKNSGTNAIASESGDTLIVSSGEPSHHDAEAKTEECGLAQTTNKDDDCKVQSYSKDEIMSLIDKQFLSEREGETTKAMNPSETSNLKTVNETGKDQSKMQIDERVQKPGNDEVQIDLKDDDNLDDEILLIEEIEETKPTKSCLEKYSFKNILQMPNKSTLEPLSESITDSKEKVDNRETQNSKVMTENKPPSSFVAANTEGTKETNASSDSSGKAPVLSVNVKSPVSDLVEEVCDQAEVTKKRSLSLDENVVSASKRSKFNHEDNTSEKKTTEDKKESNQEDSVMQMMECDDVMIVADHKPGTGTEHKEDKAADEEVKSKPLQLSYEALQSLIAARVKVFTANHKQTYLEKLNRRTRGMQSATNLWKETAKHLEKSVLELTVLNQKLEKRKAHSNAVKNLACRTIGIQVNEDKVKSVVAAVNGKQPRRSEPGNSSAALTLPPSVLLNPPPSQLNHQTARQQVPGNGNSHTKPRSSLPAGPAQTQLRFPQNYSVRPPARAPASTIPSASPQRPSVASIGRAPQQQNIKAQTGLTHVVNLIDLTEEEDSARKTVAQASRSASSQPNQAVSKHMVGGKVTPAPANGFIPQVSVPASPTGLLVGSKNQILQQPVQGTQAPLITHGSPIGIPGSQYQLVSINNPASSPSGAFIALVPGTRLPGAPNLSVAAGPSSTAPTPKSIPQTPQITSGITATTPKTAQHSLPPSFHISQKHPAPLPSSADSGNAPATAKKRPPKPGLKISRVSQGIVLSWNMPSLVDVEKIGSYQLFAYQETGSAIPRSTLWKKVGDVKALPLPMACTLTQFQEGNKYHFAVRAVDQYGRCGAYSEPSTIFLGPKT